MGKWKPKPKKESNLVHVGAVWEAETEGNYTGKFDRELDPFLSLITENDPATLRLMVFENTYKKSDRDPSFKVYAAIKRDPVVEEEEEETKEEETPPPKKSSKPSKKAKLPWDDAEEETEEE